MAPAETQTTLNVPCAPHNGATTLLVDKYAPRALTDILGNADIIALLSRPGATLPHLLFTGPPGTGKTTIARILSRGCDVLELNASDERGIDTVRDRIRAFCTRLGTNKQVVLDECDSLTAAAQQALRRLMETAGVRFILICNDISRLIEPLQSRCAVLRFSKIQPAVLIARLREITTAEDIHLTEDAYPALIRLSNGDVRAALNILQGIRYISSPERRISAEFLYGLAGLPSQEKIAELFKAVRGGAAFETLRLFNELWALRYEASDILASLLAVAKEAESFEALQVIGKYQQRAAEGVTSRLQFQGLLNDLIEAFK